ncbi:hypothetical protein QL285_033196 [Trifolium repens]|nr:hypothetical protein QL285_033196 [Trifolium repens]
MASSSTTLVAPPENIETLSIVRLSHQGHAEIETAFARRHRCYLGKTWKVIKNDKITTSSSGTRKILWS